MNLFLDTNKMPYVKKEQRELFEPELHNLMYNKILENSDKLSKGDMTYLFYKIGLARIKFQGESYTRISEVISSMQDAAEEIRRRKLNPYEDRKIVENGDVI